jgi:predicted NBD/HSP70 family sugar kinase
VVRLGRELGLPASITAEQIFAAARRGDPAARKAVDVESRRLAMAIATVTPMLDPELVILGGGIGRNGDLLLDPIESELRRLIPFRPRVVVSALGQDAVLLGAVATALEVAREKVFHRAPGRQIQQVG